MSANSKFNEKTRAKALKQGVDQYYARVTEYERRHVDCDSEIRPSYEITRGPERFDAECNCSKWRYNYVSGKLEKVPGGDST